MSKNKIQFQEGYSLFELFNDYGTDKQCRQIYLNGNFLMDLFAQSVAIRLIAL